MSGVIRRTKKAGPALGQDSFLDVVANLVAIVIILVVVVGAKTKQVVAMAHSEKQAVAPEPIAVPSIDDDQLQAHQERLQSEVTRAQAAIIESQKLERLIAESDQRLAAMNRDRGKLMDLLSVVKTAWEERQKELDASAVERAQTVSARQVAEDELKQLEAARVRLEAMPESIVAVAHLPTPMARTVFGEELHFRLKGGRLAVVPIDRLIQEIKSEFQRSVSGAREGVMESAVGPISGFVAKYQMSKSRELVSQGGSTATATRLELVNMIVEPLNEPHGTPLSEILATTNSVLDIEIAGRKPDRTTITVWVYPDSFAEFRLLKEHLYGRGFATAARPLPMDQPISGGPQGSRSQAQ